MQDILKSMNRRVHVMIKKSNAKKVMLNSTVQCRQLLYVVALSAENAECSQKDA